MRYIFYILTFFFLVSCSDEAAGSEKVDVFEIRNIGLLATSEFTIGKIIELKDEGEWYKFGDRNILISCKAKVKAGIDLSQIRDQDITVRRNSIKIVLPYPTILSFDMDPNQVKTEVQDINGLRSQFTQEEKNEILAQGEKSIRRNLGETSIISHAKNNAEVFIENFYKELGYKDVDIEFRQAVQQEMGAH
ncbi:MAG: hypothetical protein K0R65_929 [Crocinitomicaceae bacterium]|nr:hypothetical protein [Crocinitomicaceae bacterium]